ncbi:M61 family metallopeptidase [Runella aurantiaca]|uniref:M61 family peptidase n=1 Tax=Runella aurantiaca TaxID=2282308 RepID=A0A369IAN1_9BACT|nr:M61 family metallopeptidase [Runella aurantiaca]RDB06092.1 M61 family peptidase [Runella aurantiaca]
MPSFHQLFTLIFISFWGITSGFSQKLAFTVTMEEPASHLFQVELNCEGFKGEKIDFRMPVWSPGYYQKMNYPKNLQNFKVTDVKGNKVNWLKKNNSTWEVENNGRELRISYSILADRKFVANSYLDEERGYIVPTSVFLYPANQLNLSSTVAIRPFSKWNKIATGLDEVKGKPNTFYAPDYDVLYDSPILMGNLDELPVFYVKGIPHRFIGYKLGEFDRVQFVNDLKNIIEKASDIIGEIPYQHYTFLGIGPGQGGIEHANSTAISFDGAALNTPDGRIRVLNFLAHEYFHHYNVKRIRPLELGPFDYDNGNRTKLLWISEGLTVYYEYLILKRAGITNEQQLLQSLRNNMRAFENKPGRLYQSLAEASYDTWSDGPFGRTDDEVNKTISYYDKGPVVGMLLDFKIRHETQNKKSLDDVMKVLYQQFYRQKKRGFTDEEFKAVCEKIVTKPIDDILAYVSTVREIDYQKYLNYAGLEVDTTAQILPGAWTGISTRMRNDSVVVTNVEWQSPAWNAGIRRQAILLNADSKPAQQFDEIVSRKKPSESINVVCLQNNEKKTTIIQLSTKREKNFPIRRVPNPTVLQNKIYEAWGK